jgi:hypothetical protein
MPIQAAKAEGGCPKGTYPVGGGYCRDIVCVPMFTQVWDPNSWVTEGHGGRRYGRYVSRATTFSDPDATKTLHNYNQSCSGSAAKWGNMMVPKK